MCPNCVHGPVMGKTCVRGREEPGAGARIMSQCPGSAVSTGLSRCLAEATYERTLSVDGEETTLLVMDTWEPEQRVRQGLGWVLWGAHAASRASELGCAQGHCMGIATASRPLSSMKLPGTLPAMSRARCCPRCRVGHVHWARQGLGSHL